MDDKEEPIIRLFDNNVEEDEDGEKLMHRWSARTAAFYFGEVAPLAMMGLMDDGGDDDGEENGDVDRGDDDLVDDDRGDDDENW